MLSLYSPQVVCTSLLHARLSGMFASCRLLKEEELCKRESEAFRAPSLNCRRYGWKRSARACSGPDLLIPSALCLRLSAVVLKLKWLLPCWGKQTFSPSLICRVREDTENITYLQQSTPIFRRLVSTATIPKNKSRNFLHCKHINQGEQA